MLISEKKKFIFIHIKKNAGTSIASALYPCSASFPIRVLDHLAIRFFRKRLSCSPRRFGGHITAAALAEALGGEEMFQNYFSFAIVRNPWDWQSSLYNYILARPPHPLHQKTVELGSFEQYLKWHCHNIEADTLPQGVGSVFQKEYVYSDDGRLLPSFIGRFERLDEDFKTICRSIGVAASLPRLRVHKTKPYRDFYTPETRDLLARVFACDIEAFGYEF